MADTPPNRPGGGRTRIYPAVAPANREVADSPPSRPAVATDAEPAAAAPATATASTLTRDILIALATCIVGFVIGAMLEPRIGVAAARLLWLVGGLLGLAYLFLYRKHGFRRAS